MKVIRRDLEPLITNKMSPGKAIALTGPKGVGKTYFLKHIKEQYGDPCHYYDASKHTHYEKLQEGLSGHDSGSITFLFIDEAWTLLNIRKVLTNFLRQLPNTRFILTFESQSQLQPIRDLITHCVLFPLTQSESLQFSQSRKRETLLAENLVYGSYPKLLHLKTKLEKKEYLMAMADYYIKEHLQKAEKRIKPGKELQLLKIFSYLIGEEVFFHELELKTSLNYRIIERYMEHLTDLGLTHKLMGLKRNLTKEVGKHSCLYFMDNGIRNAFIGNFNPARIRSDVDKLWKNYLMSERIKQQQYRNMNVRNYFWRTYDQQELDWVEEKQGQLVGYRFTLDVLPHKIPAAWRRAYPLAEFKVITPDNYNEWVFS